MQRRPALYCGTGVDRNEPTDKGETAVLCFNADTGAVLWKTAAPFPVWSTPILKDGLLYVTSGNGDVFSDANEPDKPGSALSASTPTAAPKNGASRWATASLSRPPSMPIASISAAATATSTP